MRFLWVLALCAGVWAQNTIEGKGSGSGTVREGSGSGGGAGIIGWVKASAAEVSFSANPLGGVEATISNANSGATVSCFTLNGPTPVTNGDGKSCMVGFPLQTAANGGGYFNLVQPAMVKVVNGVAGAIDSPVNIFTPTVPPQTVQATAFGFQCGVSSSLNCKGSGGAFVWPTSAATPQLIRMHDSQTQWALMQPTNGSSFVWTYLDEYLDAIAAHPGVTAEQTFTAFPCWTQTQPYTCPDTVASYGNNTNLFPSDLTASGSPSFNNFVTNFVQHCSPNGHCVSQYIKAYEMWNEIDLNVHMAVPNNGCTTIAQCYQLLYYMVAPAAGIIRANVPNAVILTPSIAAGTNGANNDIATWLSVENTLGRISDMQVWHEYLSSGTTTPQTPEYEWTKYISTASTGFLAKQSVSGWGLSGTVDSEANYATTMGGYNCPTTSNIMLLAVNSGGSGYNLGDYFSVNQTGASGGEGAVIGVSGTAVTNVLVEATGNGYTAASGVATTDGTTPAASGLTVNITTGTFSEQDCAGMIARDQILHNASGVLGPYWYFWNYTIGNGPTTPDSYPQVYQNLQAMLVGGYFTGAAASNGMSPATWSAPFVEAGGTSALWLWTDSEAGASYSVPAGYVDYRDLFGNTVSVTNGQNVTLTTVPMMLEQ